MTKQQIFDRVWDHFITQGKPAGFDARKRGCEYQTDAGHRCAIGILLPDDSPWVTLNEQGMVVVLDEQGWLPEELRQVNLGFLELLQDAHDGAAMATHKSGDFQACFEVALRRLALAYHLSCWEESDDACV